MLEPMSNDMFVIAEAILILLDLITFALMIALIYLTAVGRALYQPDEIGLDGSRTRRIAAFAAACAIALTGTHLFLQQRWLLLAIAWLFASAAASFAIYWICVRAINRPDDMRVPHTVMVLGASALLAFGALVMLWVAGERVRLEADAKLSIDTLAQIATIAVTAISVVFTYLLKSDQSTRTAKQQIYQTLELQAIDLFRFEAKNEPLVKALWFSDKLPTSELERYQLKQYVCQMLNLFEMAYRFRVEGIMAPAVFGSWVIWIWELSNRSVFRELWKDAEDGLPLNYVPDFRSAIGLAIETAEGKADSGKDTGLKTFFRNLGRRIGCDEIERWLDQTPQGRTPR